MRQSLYAQQWLKGRETAEVKFNFWSNICLGPRPESGVLGVQLHVQM